MRHMLYRPINREPIGVNIEYGHKNRYLQTGTMQYFIFHNLFDSDNRAIGWSNYQSFRIKRETPCGTSEKVQYQQEEQRREKAHRIEKPPLPYGMI